MKIKKIGVNSYTITGCSTICFIPEMDAWMEEHGFTKLEKEISPYDKSQKQPFIKEY